MCQRVLTCENVSQDMNETNAAMCSAYDDVELLDWLRWSLEKGNNFLRPIAEGALMADLRSYNLIRPDLLALKKEWPQPA